MIAANANTVIHAIAHNKKHSVLAYAAANSILILDPYHYNSNNNQNIPKVLFSLKGHQDRVNGVIWLNENILVSISADKSIIIWSFDNEEPRIP